MTDTKEKTPHTEMIDAFQDYANLSLQIYQESGKELLKAWEQWTSDPEQILEQTQNMVRPFNKWMEELLDTQKEKQGLQEAGLAWWKDWLALLQSKDATSSEAAKKDKRFQDQAWENNSYFQFIREAYLLNSRHTLNFINNFPASDPKVTRQVEFYTKLILDAFAPTNFLFTNPELTHKTIAERGENLIKGWDNFINDLKRSGPHLNIKMTDLKAFSLGKNIAATQGKVIFQNDLMQLIQYEPTTKNVNKVPLLIIPPWINKFYILDLSPENSFVNWIVSQGFTVFLISWVNPTSKLRDKSFENYMLEGPETALSVIEEATGEKSISALGFCLGGTLLASWLAYRQVKGKARIKNATFLTSLIDFTDPGDIAVFIDEYQVATLEKVMKKTGYLDGRMLMNTFNMLRANDLMWNYYINNYLSGDQPFPFDLLYWNSDCTNLPYAMHSYYLRNMYLENRLCKNELVMDGVTIDLSKITIPSYSVSTEFDHISPWKTVFKGYKYLGGEKTFVLGGSGHIAGVINPPSNNKYGFRFTKDQALLQQEATSWYNNSEKREGSWWTHWIDWLTNQSKATCPARVPGGKIKPIGDAPGDYVRRRVYPIE
ncbi:MAG TPA: class I poly(R)-hydroxyalkanoic acid synthase [Gammaproteobacteria bacterium]|nr:class I poly(R)-hydroxyalkanoic acid synthase [Gammaproteobacteria bacterium]